MKDRRKGYIIEHTTTDARRIAAERAQSYAAADGKRRPSRRAAAKPSGSRAPQTVRAYHYRRKPAEQTEPSRAKLRADREQVSASKRGSRSARRRSSRRDDREQGRKQTEPRRLDAGADDPERRRRSEQRTPGDSL